MHEALSTTLLSSMSYCLSPACYTPQNPSTARFCQSCGAELVLGDRYRALQLLGQGGFGRTFLAVDEHLPSHPRCVIKQFLPPVLSSQQLEKATELFHQEAIRLDELGRHSQIPKLLAHFTKAQDQYLVQTYIDGLNLDQVLAQQGAFQEEQVRQLLQDLLPVLHFIHEHQVIHRDVKPANIIRNRVDEKPVLVDFGASKFATGTSLQKTGTSIGSAGYAAPEQVGGKAVFASDLYSLGVTCIHLLTTVPPFDLYSFAEGTWVWRDYLPHPVSDRLGHILDRMLEPAVNRRYGSAAIALNALNPAPARLPPLSPPPSPPLSPPPPPSQLASFGKLTALTQPGWHCSQTLTGHTNSVATLAISPNGKLLASGSFDRTIKLWHVGTGALVSTLTGHLEPVVSLAFSPDGHTLISGSVDHSIKIWHLHTNALLYTLTEQANAVLSLAIAVSPDGQAVVSGSDDHTVKIWQIGTGRLFRTLVHPRAVTAIALSPDGQTLVSGSNDNTIRLWNFGTGELLHVLTEHHRDVNSVAVSADSQKLVSGSSDHQIMLWDLDTGKRLRTLTGHLDWVQVVAISPDGCTIASGSSDHTIRLWNLTTGKVLHTLAGHTKGVNAIAFSPDGHCLISSSSDRTLKIWRKA